MKMLAFFLTLLVFTPAYADSFNPDSGRLVRIVCHGLKTAGDLSSRDPKFSIVISQNAIIEDHLGDKYDASNFLPGNKNFIVDNTADSIFSISIFRNADKLSSATDPAVYAEELLGSGLIANR